MYKFQGDRMFSLTFQISDEHFVFLHFIVTGPSPTPMHSVVMAWPILRFSLCQLWSVLYLFLHEEPLLDRGKILL